MAAEDLLTVLDSIMAFGELVPPSHVEWTLALMHQAYIPALRAFLEAGQQVNAWNGGQANVYSASHYLFFLSFLCVFKKMTFVEWTVVSIDARQQFGMALNGVHHVRSVVSTWIEELRFASLDRACAHLEQASPVDAIEQILQQLRDLQCSMFDLLAEQAVDSALGELQMALECPPELMMECAAPSLSRMAAILQFADATLLPELARELRTRLASRQLQTCLLQLRGTADQLFGNSEFSAAFCRIFRSSSPADILPRWAREREREMDVFAHLPFFLPLLMLAAGCSRQGDINLTVLSILSER